MGYYYYEDGGDESSTHLKKLGLILISLASFYYQALVTEDVSKETNKSSMTIACSGVSQSIFHPCHLEIRSCSQCHSKEIQNTS
jgi:hypothetical protein